VAQLRADDGLAGVGAGLVVHEQARILEGRAVDLAIEVLQDDQLQVRAGRQGTVEASPELA
jgi:hypothetical protein